MIDRIHPVIWILCGLLIISMLTNYVQILQIQKLEKEIAPIIIKPNIQLYKKPLENLVT
tara:strand:- start:44 stop:220 length:177 start_codon:yes stop_codon:yes gene_type:complete